jgi:hypothetical protein
MSSSIELDRTIKWKGSVSTSLPSVENEDQLQMSIKVAKETIEKHGGARRRSQGRKASDPEIAKPSNLTSSLRRKSLGLPSGSFPDGISTSPNRILMGHLVAGESSDCIERDLSSKNAPRRHSVGWDSRRDGHKIRQHHKSGELKAISNGSAIERSSLNDSTFFTIDDPNYSSQQDANPPKKQIKGTSSPDERNNNRKPPKVSFSGEISAGSREEVSSGDKSKSTESYVEDEEDYEEDYEEDETEHEETQRGTATYGNKANTFSSLVIQQIGSQELIYEDNKAVQPKVIGHYLMGEVLGKGWLLSKRLIPSNTSP